MTTETLKANELRTKILYNEHLYVIAPIKIHFYGFMFVYFKTQTTETLPKTLDEFKVTLLNLLGIHEDRDNIFIQDYNTYLQLS
jgi:hypothetical protein